MKLNVLVRSYENMGDHAEIFVAAYEPAPDETVLQFAERLLTNPNNLVIEIRMVKEPKP